MPGCKVAIFSERGEKEWITRINLFPLLDDQLKTPKFPSIYALLPYFFFQAASSNPWGLLKDYGSSTPLRIYQIIVSRPSLPGYLHLISSRSIPSALLPSKRGAMPRWASIGRPLGNVFISRSLVGIYISNNIIYRVRKDPFVDFSSDSYYGCEFYKLDRSARCGGSFLGTRHISANFWCLVGTLGFNLRVVFASGP